MVKFVATSAAVLLACSIMPAAAGGPVDDLRAADRMYIEHFTGTNTVAVEYSFFGTHWYNLEPEPVASQPGCIEKTPGSLDMDLNPLIPDYDLPGMVAAGSEEPGDIVVWKLDQPMNEDVEFEYEGTDITVTITHADVRLTAHVQAQPVFYCGECSRVFNCSLERTGGDDDNYMTINFYMDEDAREALGEAAGLESWMLSALTGNGRMQITDIDFTGSSGAGKAPIPEYGELERIGNEIEVSFGGLLPDAPYILQYAPDLFTPDPDWDTVIVFDAPAEAIWFNVPLPEDDHYGFYRLKLEIDPQ